jgi:hypothetical protein
MDATVSSMFVIFQTVLDGHSKPKKRKKVRGILTFCDIAGAFIYFKGP